MKMQTLRKLLVIISFLIFPITIYYFSPYLIIQGLIEGIITGSFIVFSFMFVFAIFLGRGLCGWVCPAGGLQDIAMIINSNKNKGKWRKIVKYIIWIPWISAIILLGIRAAGKLNIDFLYQTWNGISVSQPMALIIYYGVVILIFIPSLIAGKRSFCHSICWMAPFMQLGILLRRLLRLPGLKLETDPSKCVQCGICNKKCIMSLNVSELIKKNNIENIDCALCGECIDGCPKNVIKYKIF